MCVWTYVGTTNTERICLHGTDIRRVFNKNNASDFMCRMAEGMSGTCAQFALKLRGFGLPVG